MPWSTLGPPVAVGPTTRALLGQEVGPSTSAAARPGSTCTTGARAPPPDQALGRRLGSATTG